MKEELIDLLAKALASAPDGPSEVLGYVRGKTTGLHVVFKGQSFWVEVKPRLRGESASFYELSEQK